MCTVVIDVIIIYYSMDLHLCSLPVGGVMSQSVTFCSTGELMLIELIGYGIYYSILYYTVMCTVVVDIIIIYYSLDRHLCSLPVIWVMSQYVTFCSTGELMSIKLILYGIYYIILYYTVMCTVVIDIIIIYYRMDLHLLSMPVGMVMSQYVTFCSTWELM